MPCRVPLWECGPCRPTWPLRGPWRYAVLRGRVSVPCDCPIGPCACPCRASYRVAPYRSYRYTVTVLYSLMTLTKNKQNTTMPGAYAPGIDSTFRCGRGYLPNVASTCKIYIRAMLTASSVATYHSLLSLSRNQPNTYATSCPNTCTVGRRA